MYFYFKNLFVHHSRNKTQTFFLTHELQELTYESAEKYLSHSVINQGAHLVKEKHIWKSVLTTIYPKTFSWALIWSMVLVFDPPWSRSCGEDFEYLAMTQNCHWETTKTGATPWISCGRLLFVRTKWDFQMTGPFPAPAQSICKSTANSRSADFLSSV